MVRFKNRWLLVELIPESCLPNPQAPLDRQKIEAALKKSIQENFGNVGRGSVDLSITVKYYSPATNHCIIRVARDHHRMVWGAVSLLTAIDGTRYIPNVVNISGAIKYAQLAAIAHNRDSVARHSDKT
ncbi:hypothetical protein C8R43DRAFT_993923 [Mycena crocata]|nr:hypothetical protein C8R43DRAFT_993923 [Mycena crocata]